MIHQTIYHIFMRHHTGSENAVHMRDIAERYGLGEREVRRIVHDINYDKVVCDDGRNRKIVGCNDGYYMVGSEEERRRFRAKVVKRLLRDIELLRAVDGQRDGQLSLFNEIGEEQKKAVSKMFLTAKEMAKALGIHKNRFTELVQNDKDLPRIKINKRNKYDPDEVAKYLKNKNRR